MKKIMLAVTVCSAVLFAGCGGSDNSENSNAGTASGGNVELFSSSGCAGCHTLSEAGAEGPVGPVLDGLNLSVDQVRDQIENGGGSMPGYKGDLTPEEINQLAEFVSKSSQS